eukprot:1194588-Prorocentrum_minimum.AAC.5
MLCACIQPITYLSKAKKKEGARFAWPPSSYIRSFVSIKGSRLVPTRSMAANKDSDGALDEAGQRKALSTKTRTVRNGVAGA